MNQCMILKLPLGYYFALLTCGRNFVEYAIVSKSADLILLAIVTTVLQLIFYHSVGPKS